MLEKQIRELVNEQPAAQRILLFGANVEETAEVVSLFLKKILNDLIHLETKTFDIGGKQVEIKIGELPNDMNDMLALVGNYQAQ